ncbi:MAG TPA: RDD family protein [Candidatus Binataceae bacterium]|nr:RDD family protein [Candidatus Binataceae bacterium]
MSVAQDSGGAVHGLFSPEGVRLDLPIAGPGLRILAYAIDFGVIVLILGGLVIALLIVLPGGSWIDRFFHSFFHQVAHISRQAARDANAGRPFRPSFGLVQGLIIAAFIVAHFAVEFGYFIVSEMLTNGRSLGKYIIGLRVVRRDGMPIDLRASIVRNLMRIVDLLPEYYVAGLVSMVLSPSGERLGDHVAGTIVIRLDRPPAAPEIGVRAAPAIAALTRDQLARLGALELKLIRATIRRAATLPEERRAALVAEVIETLRARLEIAELPPGDHLEFLRDLLAAADRHSRGDSL